MKLGEIAQSFVCSLFSISETDHAPEQGEILMDPAALPTVSSLMSTLISLTLTQQQPALILLFLAGLCSHKCKQG